MATDPAPLTYADLVKRAAQVADPAAESEAVVDLLDRFEDRDDALHEPEMFRAELDEEVGKVDPEAEDPFVQMTGAVAAELAYRQEARDADREALLRLAARATWSDGGPPPAVADWLAGEGVKL